MYMMVLFIPYAECGWSLTSKVSPHSSCSSSSEGKDNRNFEISQWLSRYLKLHDDAVMRVLNNALTAFENSFDKPQTCCWGLFQPSCTARIAESLSVNFLRDPNSSTTSIMFFKDDKPTLTLGEGSFKQVTRGLQVSPEGAKSVAIACMRDQSNVTAVQDEAACMHHVNGILSDIFVRKNQVFLVQQDLGQTLRNVLDAARLSPDSVRKIFTELVNKINEMHTKKGLCHRDLKPENIYASSDNKVTIGDFGLAIQQSANPSVCMAGTQNYLPPVGFSAVDGKNQDYFAAAIILLQMQLGININEYDIKDTREYYDVFCRKHPQPGIVFNIICELLNPSPAVRSEFWNNKMPTLIKTWNEETLITQ